MAAFKCFILIISQCILWSCFASHPSDQHRNLAPRRTQRAPFILWDKNGVLLRHSGKGLQWTERFPFGFKCSWVWGFLWLGSSALFPFCTSELVGSQDLSPAEAETIPCGGHMALNSSISCSWQERAFLRLRESFSEAFVTGDLGWKAPKNQMQ